jgi:hypothetical protein
MSPGLLKRALRRPLLRRPRFVIVGTGRSGTRYISQVLTLAGIRCGHEAWWTTRGTRAIRLLGDASWLALFNLDDFRGHVYHQVRDPIDVISSLAATSMNPEWRARHPTSHAFHAHRSQYVTFSGDPLVDAMQFVNVYLTEAERVAERTWRVEDVDAEIIIQIAADIGRRLTREAAQAALRSVPPTTHGREHGLLGWDGLPDGPLKERLILQAEGYGYLPY